jgi:hypothetical protein
MTKKDVVFKPKLNIENSLEIRNWKLEIIK